MSTAQRLEKVFWGKRMKTGTERSPGLLTITDSLHILLKLVPQSQQTEFITTSSQKGFSLSREVLGVELSIYFKSKDSGKTQVALTKHERCLPRSASSSPPGNGTFPAHIPYLRGQAALRIMQIPPFLWEAAV